MVKAYVSLAFRKRQRSQVWGLMPIIQTTEEAKAGGLPAQAKVVRSHLRTKIQTQKG
jgi:hypothetical protein